MALDKRRCPVRQDEYKRHTACKIALRQSYNNRLEGSCGNCGKVVKVWFEPRCVDDWYVCPDCYPMLCMLNASRPPELVGAKVGEVRWIG